MKILDRYILGKFLSTFFFVVLILIAVICVIDFVEKNDDFIRTKPSTFLILTDYFANFIPYYGSMLSPITVFIATVFVTAQLATRTEVIAILSSGVSFRRFLQPYVIGALLIGGLIFYLNNYVVPHANRTRVAFELKYIKKGYSYDRRNVHIQVASNTYVYLESYSNASNTGFRFTLETIRDGKLLAKSRAERVVWQPASKKWRMEDYSLRVIDSASGAETLRFGSQIDTTLRLSPDDFGSDYLQYETLTTPELKTQIAELEARGSDSVTPYRIEAYLRVTYPFAIVILTVIGVILSARKSREGIGFQVALGFLLAFVYIISFIMSRSIAQAGSIDPLLACWLPNIIFSGIGVVLFKTVPR